MQMIRSIILCQLVGFPIQVVDDPILDAIGDSSDRLAEKWRCGVGFCGGEAEDDVMASDLEGLD
jgi:hypothetical protein